MLEIQTLQPYFYTIENLFVRFTQFTIQIKRRGEIGMRKAAAEPARFQANLGSKRISNEGT